MPFRRRLLSPPFTRPLFALLLWTACAAALAASAQLTVSAVVPRKAWVRVEGVPAMLVVTPVDVERGYVDVPQATVVTLRSNAQAAFVFRFALDPRVAASATVGGLAHPLAVGPEGATANVAGRFRQEARVGLRWRLQLAEGVRAGEAPWPVRLQVDAD